MRHFFLATAIILITAVNGFTQTNKFPATGATGIGTTTPAGSSLLEVKSTTKGVLLSRMTKAQRDAIASPATGLLVYQTDNTPGFYVYDGATWKAVTATGANKALSNLSVPTAVNTDLLPGVDGLVNLGSVTNSWKNAYIENFIFLKNKKFISNAGGGTFVGENAGAVNTGFAVTAVGTDAMASNTSASYNTAIGYAALHYNDANYNTAVGYSSLYGNTTGYQNTAVGQNALETNGSGHHNTAVGSSSLDFSSGSYNTAIGTYAGHYTTDYCTYVGYNTYSSSSGITNSMALGYYASVGADNQVRIGNTSVTSIGGQVGWSTLSDGRYKKNVKENVPGLAFIKQLRPVTYNLDTEAFDKSRSIQRNSLAADDPSRGESYGKSLVERSKIIYTGFIAQEVDATAKKMHYDFSGVDVPKNNKDYYGLRYADFVIPLVKAVQELSKMNDDKDKKIEGLEARLYKLEQTMNVTKSASIVSVTGETILGQNFPNPSQGNTIIPFKLPKDVHSAQLVIFETESGKILRTINIGNGQTRVPVSMNGLPGGMYSYSLIINGKTVGTKQMILSR